MLTTSKLCCCVCTGFCLNTECTEAAHAPQKKTFFFVVTIADYNRYIFHEQTGGTKRGPSPAGWLKILCGSVQCESDKSEMIVQSSRDVRNAGSLFSEDGLGEFGQDTMRASFQEFTGELCIPHKKSPENEAARRWQFIGRTNLSSMKIFPAYTRMPSHTASPPCTDESNTETLKGVTGDGYTRSGGKDNECV